jgi:hypothetical protein
VTWRHNSTLLSSSRLAFPFLAWSFISTLIASPSRLLEVDDFTSVDTTRDYSGVCRCQNSKHQTLVPNTPEVCSVCDSLLMYISFAFLYRTPFRSRHLFCRRPCLCRRRGLLPRFVLSSFRTLVSRIITQRRLSSITYAGTCRLRA